MKTTTFWDKVKLPSFNEVAAMVLAIILIITLTRYGKLTADIKQAFIGGLLLILGFLFGSSVGSRAKDSTIANSTPPTDISTKN